MRYRRSVVALALLAVWFGPTVAGAPSDPQTAAIMPNLWFDHTGLDWFPDDGPTWMSLGHSAAVVCIQPVDAQGKALATSEGAAGVRLTVYRITKFNADTGAPAEVESLHEELLAGERLAGRKSVRLKLHVPDSSRKRIAGSGFRYCLYGGIAYEMRGGAMTKASLKLAVIQLLHDDTVPRTSRRDDPYDHKAGTNWIDREQVKAPWRDGTAMKGKLSSGEDGKLAFAKAAPRALRPKNLGPVLDDVPADGPTDDQILADPDGDAP